MINLTLNSTAQAAQAAPIAAKTGAPSSTHDAGSAQPLADRPGAAPGFADLLGQLDLAGAEDATDAPVGAGSAAGPASAADDGGDSDAGQQPVLTAAMTMAIPLLPVALAAANAAANTSAATAGGPRSDAGTEAPSATPAAAIGAAPSAGAIPAAVTMALAPVDDHAPRIPLPARPAADAATGTDASFAGTPRSAAPAVPAGGADPAAKVDAASARDSASVAGAVPAAQVPAAQRDNSADTVALPGPPSAWRQSLREALGERLQLQAGRGLEQAVIRLDPPQLGRIEIAIRHSAGSLEVTLSATNGDVLRQLHAVSDNLRSDLAQRQYSEVAVTVTPAPRSAAANPFGADAQDRGRQGGREQEQQAPGLALFDDGPAASAFSLTGRE